MNGCPRAPASADRERTAMTTSSLRPLDPDAFDYWKAQHLLNRAGFGGTPSQVRTIANLGVDAAVDYIVDYHAIAAESVEANLFDPSIMRPATQAERNAMQLARQRGDEAAVERARRERQRRQQADRRQMGEIKQWWLERLIETPRPLEEKMTLFLHGHFATNYRGIEDSYHMFLQNQLFRSHATGNFQQLVHGIIRDPAMLRYLNNNQNRKQSPNENLARELMELFTLGEGNAYTEDDIKEGARALTGYTYMDDRFVDKRSQQYGNQHDHSIKRILGRVGNWDGDDLVNLIFEQDYCSQFIVWKLYRFFANDMPGTPDENTQQFILNLAQHFREEDYEFKPVLKTLFKSRHFYERQNTAALVKSPVQLVVQAIRSLHTPTRPLSALLSAADLMGQDLFYPPNVKGWDGGRSWINTSTMFVRQNLMVYLITGRRPEAYNWQSDGKMYDARHLVEHLADARGDVEDRSAVTYLLRFNLGTEPHEDRVDNLTDFVKRRGSVRDNDCLIELLSLITAMPEYQLC